MRGVLHKTEQGWVVKYDQRTWQDPSAEDGELPLHPTDLCIPSYVGGILGEIQEVEFEIVKVPSEHDVTHGTFIVYKNYAKLINPQTVPLPVFQQVPTSVLEQDVVETMARDFYWSRQPKGKLFAESSRPDIVIGYVEGYNKAKETLYTEQDINTIKRILIYDDDKNDSEKILEAVKVIQSLKQTKKD